MIPCGGLSWLFISFWAHVNNSASYRILIGRINVAASPVTDKWPCSTFQRVWSLLMIVGVSGIDSRCTLIASNTWSQSACLCASSCFSVNATLSRSRPLFEHHQSTCQCWADRAFRCSITAKPKLHLFDQLRICCATSCITKSTANP